MTTVLVVDDVKTDRELIGKVVTDAGHLVLYATDGEEALAQARACHPGLILLDVIMPRMDGFGACRRLKADAETSAIPVVMVTHKSAPSDRFWGKKQGADHYLTKPFTPSQLQEVLRLYAR
jgi:twitching motility two-component system response regulator PilH